MRPAFSSARQAGAFALLLLALLLSPVLVGKKFLPPREEIYSSIWWESGDFPYIDGQIFRERGSMDIVFMGSSHIWAAFNTPRVQEGLSERHGVPAVVRTFGWGVPGFDEIYFVAQDLLENRKVRMLVIDDNANEFDLPHPMIPRMFRWGDNAGALDGLPISFKAAYYFASIAGIPRNLLGLLRPDLPSDLSATSYWQIHSCAQNLATQLGTVTARIGFHENRDAQPDPFVEYAPVTSVRSSDVCIYPSDGKTNLTFSAAGLPLMQLHFAQKLVALAREHGSKLVMIHIPTFDERHSVVISTPAYWPDILGANVTFVGIPPATLFKGMSDDEIRKLYSDHFHFNENGQNYFTALMTPVLLKIYESQVKNP